MRNHRSLLLAVTLILTAPLSAQQSGPVAQIQAGPPQSPLPPSLRSNNAPPPNSVDAVRISGGVMASMLIKKTSPVVSECGHSGTVVLHAIIGKNGKVLQLSALSGPPQLYGPVIDAVRQWQYKPYLLNGEPVNVDTTITDIVDVNGCPSVNR
jgi:hypothetical protein